MTRLCTAPGCTVRYFSTGLCQWHYGRKRVGDLAALDGPRPVTRCVDCGVAVRRTDSRLCAACRPEVQPLFVNPMICLCEVPDARPDRDFGMCSKCARKPLSLMKAAS